MKIFQSTFFRDSIWTVLGSGVNALQALLITYILINYLGSTVFGEYTFFLTSVTTLSIFCLYGANVSLIIFLSKNKDENSKQLAINTIFKISLILWIMAGFVTFFLKNKYNIELSDWIVLFLLLGFLNLKLILEAIIQGENKFVLLAKINILTFILNILIMLFLTKYYGLFGAFVSLIFNHLLKIIFLYNSVSFKFQIDSKKLNKDILIFSSPLAIQEYMYYISSWFLLYLVVKYGSYTQVSLYNIAIQLSMLVAFIPGVLKNLILAKIGQNLGDAKNILKKSVLFNMIITILFSLTLYIFLPIIIGFYGDEYSSLYKIMPILLLMVVFNSMSNVYFQYSLLHSSWYTNLSFRFVRDFGVFPIFYIFMINSYSAVISMSLSLLIINLIFFVIIKLNVDKFKAYKTEKLT